jgi:hypothetical protein
MWKRTGSLFLGLSLLAVTSHPQASQFQNNASTQQQKRLPGSKKRKKKIMKLQAQDSGRSLDLHVNDSFSVQPRVIAGRFWKAARLRSASAAIRLFQDKARV